ncbi:MAG: hypothetical protein H6704_20625 [Myxococcales bacterium]|nr:hypothetical protein [Myxococcales bacterium]
MGTDAPRDAPPLGVTWLINPPVGSVADPGTEVGVLLTVRDAAADDWPVAPLHWAFAQVGAVRGTAASQQRAALAAALDAGGPSERARWVGGGPPRLLADALAAETLPHARSLAEALREGARALAARPADAAARLLVAVHGPLSESYEDILAAAAELDERSVGIDVLCAHPTADLGLLTRLANLDGGEVMLTDVAEPVACAEALERRLATLRAQRLLDVRLELKLTSLFQPQRLFRVAPRPLFLRTLRLGPDERTVRLEVGPLARDDAPTFLLTGTLPRRRIGRYRLFELTAGHRTDAASAKVDGLHGCTLDPAEAATVEAAVRAAQERVEGVAWVEDVARAYAEGDARRVAATLDRLVRHFAVMDRSRAVREAAALRMRFLRSGTLGRMELNRLRRLATG